MARRTDYKSEYVAQAKKLAQHGLTDVEIADFFNVTVRTIHRWKLEHSEFSKALKVGKSIADERVEDSLYRRACGYSHESEKIFCSFGKVKRVKTVMQYPPDTMAAMYWLNNRKRKEWGRKPGEQEGDEAPTPVKVTVEVKDARRGGG